MLLRPGKLIDRVPRMVFILGLKPQGFGNLVDIVKSDFFLLERSKIGG
jgi:hypothetical protein